MSQKDINKLVEGFESLSSDDQITFISTTHDNTVKKGAASDLAEADSFLLATFERDEDGRILTRVQTYGTSIRDLGQLRKSLTEHILRDVER